MQIAPEKEAPLVGIQERTFSVLAPPALEFPPQRDPPDPNVTVHSEASNGTFEVGFNPPRLCFIPLDAAGFMVFKMFSMLFVLSLIVLLATLITAFCRGKSGCKLK